MKLLFYGTKSYDKPVFEKHFADVKNLEAVFFDSEFDYHTAKLSKGFDAICIFVNTRLDAESVKRLKENGVKLILLRCAGYNNVDIQACKKANITVLRVPNYSPEAVAEMAMGLALAVNRKIHKAYIKVRENNFALTGLTGVNFYGKTAGIIGAGKIGLAMARLCRGFGMKVLAYDKFPREEEGVEYVELPDLLKRSDLVSLHCPLTSDSYHLINEKTIAMMKDGVILVNTSRGGLIKTDDLIKGIRDKKFFGVALDVYEEEDGYVFENLEDDILEHSITARLLSFPNVIVTSHQGFLTQESINAIAQTTADNAVSFMNGKPIEENKIC